MEPINWIHISDIHMRAYDSWSHDIVLKSLCDHVQLISKEKNIDFILITGDLAFSGRSNEYSLVSEFLDQLSTKSNIPKKNIFCVPGNHDINRNSQKLCFLGARRSLTDQPNVDLLFESKDELETILKRQDDYLSFQKGYFIAQNRKHIENTSSYVSFIKKDNIKIALIGLDSAWLAEGGSGDQGKLLIGERQIINATNMIQEEDEPVNIIIAFVHHPLHHLQDFDRQCIIYKIEKTCHFLHCGHLHKPEVRIISHGDNKCLTIATGAAYETRQSTNAYSVVTLDLLNSKRIVKTAQYDPIKGAFSYVSSDDYSIEIIPSKSCDAVELAENIQNYNPDLGPYRYYLTSLLLGQKAELPIKLEDSFSFATLNVVRELPDDDFKQSTLAFMKFRNLIRVFYGQISLSTIFDEYGEVISQYGHMLKEICEKYSQFKDKVEILENEAQVLNGEIQSKPYSHTTNLFNELIEEQQWALLSDQALRHIKSPDKKISVLAKRMLALSLANSNEQADKEKAIEMYNSLVEKPSCEFTDIGNLAILYTENENFPKAKSTVHKGIERFPEKVKYYISIGQTVVEATGDKEFRNSINSKLSERENHE